MVPSLFQQTNYSDLVFSVVLYFFETSTCNHSFFQRYWFDSQFQCQPSIRWMALVVMKEQLEPLILSNVLSFWRIGVEARRYHSYQQGYLLGFKQVYIMKDSLLFNDIHMPKALCIFHNTYCRHPLQQAFCGWFEKIWRVMCLFEENLALLRCLFIPQS